jgi:hypothetical protein
LIYALDPAARSRITTAYMATLFGSAAAFSALASAIYDAGGWDAVSALGGALAAAGVIVWAIEQSFGRRSSSASASAPSPLSETH